jgi:hypothetical protein
MAGGRTAVIAPPIPAMPSDGPAPYGIPRQPSAPAPAPAPYEPPLVELGHHVAPGAPAGSRSRTLVWIITIVAALVIGGGGAAAILLWQK